MVSNFLMVAIGAAFGGVLRVLSTNWIKKRWTYTFPFATFAINIIGSLLMGIVISISFGAHISLLLGTGFLGSFTTFSTFNVENMELMRRKRYKYLYGYIGGSYILGITAIFIGMAIGKLIYLI